MDPMEKESNKISLLSSQTEIAGRCPLCIQNSLPPPVVINNQKRHRFGNEIP